MYHRYDGGGVTVDGPSLLVRKNFKETVSLSGNYYVDNISSASIDVITSGASKYSEERTEYSLAGDYLYGKSILSAGVTYSDESDYQASTYSLGVSQDFFGDLTTLSFGYALGQDDVSQNGNDDFEEEIDRHSFRVGISQIVTPRLLLAANYELITDEGYLNNPYRSYRYLSDPLDPAAGFQFAREVYPSTRTSDAASLQLRYRLPWEAAVGGQYRFFTDDWGIDAHTILVSYTHVLYEHWTLDFQYRWYSQGQADFYQDLFLFPSQDEKDYRARDKEMSEFSDQTLSFYLSYQRPLSWRYAYKAGISLQYDRIAFDYDNFSDLTEEGFLPGDEPNYSFDADVYKILFTLWY
ncbi:DUF3570 domain-containing protein [Pseudohalioglobus sediminis]|uniref:DUF3570 domain-containing protein n=2 Tax=Pseudohalioglobus sediminis TaxID=2606449 RepID=A0A5B0X2I4_9GAMM|nr:DUF3570 domain-containing protein [Pseudohalioglobus sediminis]